MIPYFGVIGIIYTGYWAWRDCPDRMITREVDFGYIWTEKERDRPFWRVSWIEGSGEVYGVELIPSPFCLPDDRRRFVVLAKGLNSRAEVERYMRGWDDQPKWIGPLENHLARRDR